MLESKYQATDRVVQPTDLVYYNSAEPEQGNVRSVTPGKFLWPGAEAHLQYAKEEFERTADSTLVISK